VDLYIRSPIRLLSSAAYSMLKCYLAYEEHLSVCDNGDNKLYVIQNSGLECCVWKIEYCFAMQLSLEKNLLCGGFMPCKCGKYRTKEITVHDKKS
jgi:hypothetical protein